MWGKGGHSCWAGAEWGWEARAADNPYSGGSGEREEEEGLPGSKLLAHPPLPHWTLLMKHKFKEKWLRQQLQSLGSQGWAGRERGPSELALCDCMSQMPMELVRPQLHQPFISFIINQGSVFVKEYTSKLFLELFTNKDSYNTVESSSGLFLHTFIPSQIYWTLTSF